MRIALDATYSVGSGITGVGVYSRELLRGLPAACPQVDWRFLYRPHRFLRALSQPRTTGRGLLLDRVPIRRAQLFHGLNQRLPARRFPAQVVTFHDLFVLTGDYSTAEFRARFAQQARHAAQRADLIVAVSTFTAHQAATLLGFPRDRIRVIHHGVSVATSTIPTPREKLILHVGAIQKRKNVRRLIEAFAAAPQDWRLVLAGGAGYGAEAILDAVRRSPHAGRIEIMGYLSEPELHTLYRKAGLLAFPSLDEGFGLPVIEAMAADLPVLTSNRSALPEVAGDAALLVDPLETASIAEGLRLLCTDEELRNDLARRGRRRAAQFTWPRAIEQTLSVYRELVSIPAA